MAELFETKLIAMKRSKTYIALSLYPPIGATTIQKDGNRLFINEGRYGKYEGVSEQVYDTLVRKYDSRS